MKSGRRDFRPSERQGRTITSPLDMIEGILATTLKAAHGAVGKNAGQSLTGSTTATLNLIEWSDESTFFLTGKTATITNRSAHFCGAAGSYLVAFKIGGEFRPLPTFQTLRGRLMADLVSDDVIGWPKFCLMEVLGVGRVFAITGSTSTTIDVDGDVTDFVAVDDVVTLWSEEAPLTVTAVSYSSGTTTLTIEEDFTVTDELSAVTVDDLPDGNRFVVSGDYRPECITGHFVSVSGCGGADGIYTIFGTSYASGNTTIIVSETIPSGTAGGDLVILRSLMQPAIYPDPRLTYASTALGVADPGSVTIGDPSLVLGGSDPLDPDEMFLEGMLVEITGSEDGLNDGVFRCRKAFTDNGTTITIWLDGEIVSTSSPLGEVTLKVPPPLCVTSKSMAVLRWYRASLYARSIVHTLPPDGDGWCEIVAADIGPSVPAEPDDP